MENKEKNWIQVEESVYIYQFSEDTYEVLHMFKSAPYDTISLYHSTVNLTNYTDEELYNELIAAYGSLEALKEARPSNWKQLAAEIVAENEAFSGTINPQDFQTLHALNSYLTEHYGIIEEDKNH